MKTEWQEVYTAFDGKRFTDEKECSDYEIKLAKEIPIEVELRDCEGNVLPFSFFLENGLEGIWGMCFSCEAEKEKFRKIVDEDASIGDVNWEADCLHYVYDTDDDMWVDAERYYFDLMNKVKDFKEKWGVNV